MRKFYTLLLLCLMAVIGMTAHAGDQSCPISGQNDYGFTYGYIIDLYYSSRDVIGIGLTDNPNWSQEVTEGDGQLLFFYFYPKSEDDLSGLYRTSDKSFYMGGYTSVSAGQETSTQITDATVEITFENDAYTADYQFRYENGVITSGKVSGICADKSEIYGAVSADGKTFTVYYDKAREERGGWSPEGWREDYDVISKVKKIVFDESLANARPTSTKDWFYWFEEAETLEHPENLNTSDVTTMSSMFDHCYALKSLDLSSWNTANVEKMSFMFDYCKALDTLYLNNWNTESVTTMQLMFSNCESLTELDIRSFDFRNVTNVGDMFAYCKKLRTIYCEADLSETGIYSEGMFYDCKNLKGGRGFKFSAEHYGLEYARPDKVEEDGYFTSATVEDVLCQVTSEGLLNLQRAEFSVLSDDPETPAVMMELYSATDWFVGKDLVLYTNSDGYSLGVLFYPPSLKYMVGEYSLEKKNATFPTYAQQEKGVYIAIFLSDISFTLTTNDTQTAYNLEYNLTVMVNEQPVEHSGKVYNICADEIKVGIKNVESDKVQSTKVLRDGMLLIERAGKTYNMMGTEVR